VLADATSGESNPAGCSLTGVDFILDSAQVSLQKQLSHGQESHNHVMLLARD
jgi:hypothetical protein